MNVAEITRPTLLLDEARCRRNIERMAEKAKRSNVRFRPHFKTHQSAQIGRWFREVGVEAITVSSVKMAEYFAAHGWDDITIAFPANWREIEAINRLAESVRLGLLVDAPETVRFLAEALRHPVDVWIDVDTGYQRTGVPWDAADDIAALASGVQAASVMTLRGLLTHSGHAYGARLPEWIRHVYDETFTRMANARATLEAAGFGRPEISIGDTPTCSVIDDLSAVDEIRPGNFAFYDMMQVAIGSCTEDDVAVAVACPVVAKYPQRRQIVVHGGGVHLSKDFIVDPQGRTTYGAVALPSSSGWGPVVDAHVSSVSQEHGVILADDETFNRIQIGDLLMVLPIHSCMTADILKSYMTLSGETIEMMA
jgi:D-serine deaminase-like pyridoxal phosphate-dependent protein